jgi:hypothetical protein
VNVGDRVRLSPLGKTLRHIFPNPEVKGTVVLPGKSRGGLYLRVRIDGASKSRTFAQAYWEVEP